MSYATDGYLGANFTRRTTDPEHTLGQVVFGDSNTVWIYVKASSAIADNDVVLVNSTTFTAATDATSGKHTAEKGFASGEYGWVRQTAGATG